MATLLGAGYLTWRTDTANSVFGHNNIEPYFRSALGIWQVIERGRDIMPTNIFTKFDNDQMKTLT